jgi:hypothetical protein
MAGGGYPKVENFVVNMRIAARPDFADGNTGFSLPVAITRSPSDASGRLPHPMAHDARRMPAESKEASP